ncbi:MAG TPA: carbohydrate ABC transporter permease [Termitinemataceae bacterium]|uniref:carbohydrate ABC transporter permease n=1 Tax=Treponema sp. J25 TaxID=2094121 RepID=UPI00105239B8|nr:carbohydrate ABC transporter permease [Treponema sp. J25]TCW60362.1 carbohydrate ABC transporter permease [Treponema sp. J25]HOJ98781.1 carbohydrate ABC transporter permease [Termitinemataceae bacterium]HOM23085.1 carbohydrate ABC transporter permease [Termitinemataceae bacterium]HPP99935.1 carbohydrate ABC transporter permease [Termitinemataceae bacterium]
MTHGFLKNKHYLARDMFRICNGLFMCLLLILMLIPLLKVFADSLDRSAVYGLTLWPRNPSLEAYRVIVSNKNLYRPLLVSIFTTVTGTLLGLLITTLAAYVLIQKDLIGRGFFSKFIFITMIFNGGLVPTFLVLKNLGMTNTLWAVLLPASVNAFNIFLMKNFFDQIPTSLFESAEIDGASPPQVFFMIVLPLSAAALASIGLFFAVQYWNEFFAYVMYVSKPELYNFQVKLRELILNEQNLNDPTIIGYGNMVKNASVVVTVIPFLFIYPFAQRYFIQGVTVGAVKE